MKPGMSVEYVSSVEPSVASEDRGSASGSGELERGGVERSTTASREAAMVWVKGRIVGFW